MTLKLFCKGISHLREWRRGRLSYKPWRQWQFKTLLKPITHIEAVHIFTLFKICFLEKKTFVLKIKCVVAVSLVPAGVHNHCSWKGSTYLSTFLTYPLGPQYPEQWIQKSSFTYSQILKCYQSHLSAPLKFKRPMLRFPTKLECVLGKWY